MKTLHTRLDHQKEEVLAYTRKFGRFRAMQRFRVADYLCFSRWLKEASGDESIGICPKFSPNGNQSLGEYAVQTLLQTLFDLKTENARLNEEIEHLKWLLSSSKEKEELEALAILEACQS